MKQAKKTSNYWWKPEEDAIVRANYGILPVSQFVHLLPGRTLDAIQLHALRYLKLSADHLAMSNLVDHSRYERNNHFFSEIQPLASYWAGFIAADGCIDSPKGGISISLAAKDREHLERLNTDMQFTRPLRYSIPKSRGGPQYNFTVCGPILIADLWRNYGIGPRKSLTLMAPRHLNLDNTLAFIIGYIDGDGCIRIAQAPGRTDRLLLKILGTHDLLNWIVETFHKISPPILNHHEPKAQPTPYPIWVYSISGHRASHILSQLLSIDVPKMPRKWDIVRHFQTIPTIKQSPLYTDAPVAH